MAIPTLFGALMNLKKKVQNRGIETPIRWRHGNLRFLSLLIQGGDNADSRMEDFRKVYILP
jgi:hypothetical protein